MKINKILTPVMPVSAHDPSGQKPNLRQAKSEVDKRFREINKQMRSLVKGLNPTVKSRNDTAQNKTVYEYRIDAQKYDAINVFIQRLLNEQILDNPQGSFTHQWWLNTNLTLAYEDGTSDIIQSAKNIAPVEVVGLEIDQQLNQLSLERQQFTPGYQSRLALVYARVFNEMKGLTDSMRTDLAETLARGMQAGKGVRALGNDVSQRVGVGHSRAMRIVRTEVLNAYRTATNVETDAINEDIYADSEWHMQLLWYSALADTSRHNHVSRHGSIYSVQEVEEFYDTGANAINCLCSQSAVLVNKKKGKVLQEKLLERMEKQKKAYLATH